MQVFYQVFNSTISSQNVVKKIVILEYLKQRFWYHKHEDYLAGNLLYFIGFKWKLEI